MRLYPKQSEITLPYEDVHKQTRFVDKTEIKIIQDVKTFRIETDNAVFIFSLSQQRSRRIQFDT